MKSYLAWNRTEQVCPAIALSPPPSALVTLPFPSSLQQAPFGSLTSSSAATLSSNESLLSAVAAGGNSNPHLSLGLHSPFGSLLDRTPQSTGLAENPFASRTLQFTSPSQDHSQLSTAAAEYLLAAFASNANHFACPSTPYQPATPSQEQPATPQQSAGSNFDSRLGFSPFSSGQSDPSSTSSFQQHQNAVTTAALVAALQQRIEGNNANSNELGINETRTTTDFLAGTPATRHNNFIAGDKNLGPVEQLSLSAGAPLANKLANVCAAAATIAPTVTTSTGLPATAIAVETGGVAPASSSSVRSSATPIILSASANCSTLAPSIDPANLASSTLSNPPSVASLFSQQHPSAFQLVSPQTVSSQKQSQQLPSSFNSYFQQQHLQKQSVPEQPSPLHIQRAIQASLSSSEQIQQQQQQQHQQHQSLTLPSSLSTALPLPPPSSSLPPPPASSLQQQQQAVPPGPSHPTHKVHSSPMNQAAAAAAVLYPQLMCQALLDQLGPHILRSRMNSTQPKPIPNNEPVDLASFRTKEPQDWVQDDVLAFVLDVARRNQIPVENISLHKFATMNGARLLLMNEQSFQDRDPNNGSLLYNEFRKIVSDDTALDDWSRLYKDAEEEPRPSTSRSFNMFDGGFKAHTASNAPSAQMVQSLNGLLGVSSPLSPLIQTTLSQHHAAAAAAVAVASQQFLKPTSMLGNVSAHEQSLSAQLAAAASKNQEHNAGLGAYNSRADQGFHGVSSKIKKNKDGRPRKRSQHTKGNKLWEFIRDALKDPSTCPAVVRWEDPIEGVFRIVESEKLARLWGEKKNNQKMTYEKLSRAMRTYYEKQILVPVPKTGLYPKKLVYKFGPGAHGWTAPPHLVAASNASIAAMRLDPMDTS